jgi:16S rRNA (cytosine967-C5)-methyltransferase
MRENTARTSKNSSTLNPEIRDKAIDILEEYASVSKSIRLILRDALSSADYSQAFRTALEALCISVIRYLNTIDFLISRGLKPGMKKYLKATDHALLRLGIYETHWLGQSLEVIRKYYPDNIPKIIEKVNSMDLNQLVENKPEINRLSLKYSHPTFFIKTIMQNLPHEDTLNLLKANNSGYPYYVRPNRLLNGFDDFHEVLQQLGAKVQPDSDYPWILQVLNGIDRIVTSDYFVKGHILIQEKGSIAIIDALNPQSGDLVWDACAAPGQKTQLICEVMNQQGRVIASDIYPNRLRNAIQHTKRLGCRIIDWILADATRCPVKGADRVLIDAPCSSTGILYSHPSFKWRLNKESLFAFMSVQNKILDGIVKSYYDHPDTEFVYASCSVLPHEGESQIDSIMQSYDIELLDIDSPGIPGYPGFKCSSKVRRLFPHLHKCGGFFIARFKLTY